MGDIVDLRGQPIPLGDDISPELITDLARFAEGLLDEKTLRRRYQFDESTWEAFGSNDKLIETIETEKTRRIRSGAAKREKAQQLITKAPSILDSIMTDPAASPRHRVDAIKTLDTFAADGPEQTAPTDRLIITINW